MRSCHAPAAARVLVLNAGRQAGRAQHLQALTMDQCIAPQEPCAQVMQAPRGELGLACAAQAVAIGRSRRAGREAVVHLHGRAVLAARVQGAGLPGSRGPCLCLRCSLHCRLHTGSAGEAPCTPPACPSSSRRAGGAVSPALCLSLNVAICRAQCSARNTSPNKQPHGASCMVQAHL